MKKQNLSAAQNQEALAISHELHRAKELIRQNDLQQAAFLCQAVLTRAARQPQAAYMYGSILCSTGKPEQGKPWLKIALDAMPRNAELVNDWACCLLACGETKGAETNFRKALKLDSTLASAWANLCDIYSARDDNGEAFHALENYLALSAGDANAWAKHAAFLIRKNQFGDAFASLDKAFNIDPQCHFALFNLSWAQSLIGNTAAALAAFEQTKAADRSIYDWQSFLFQSSAIPELSAEAVAQYHREFAARLDEKFATYRPQHRNSAVADRPLRVGLVSSDLREHPVGYFMIALLEHLDTSQFTPYAYSSHVRADSTTQRIRKLCPHWHDVSALSDSAVHQMIVDDEIDILLDLSGHSTNNRLTIFAARAAPVQASYLGYFATTGLQSMDYIIVNPDLMPDNERSQYTETPWYLPHAHVCYTPHAAAPGTLRAAKTGRGITFGSLHKMAKVNSKVLETWLEILQGAPDSQLMIMNSELKDPHVHKALSDFFTAGGIDAERVILKQSVPHAEYLAAHQQVDILLDTFPYNGTTTTMDALWMGVPVLTVRGDRYCAHMAEAVLNQAGLQDWVASDRQDYVRLAIKYASNPADLEPLRSGMRERLLNSPLLNAPLFARDFGEALRGMWKKWCAEQENTIHSAH